MGSCSLKTLGATSRISSLAGSFSWRGGGVASVVGVSIHSTLGPSSPVDPFVLAEQMPVGQTPTVSGNL